MTMRNSRYSNNIIKQTQTRDSHNQNVTNTHFDNLV